MTAIRNDALPGQCRHRRPCWDWRRALRWPSRQALDEAWERFHHGGRHPRHVGRFYAHCFSCGNFKSRPSADCSVCGDSPVSHNGDRFDFDRAYDWPYA